MAQGIPMPGEVGKGFRITIEDLAPRPPPDKPVDDPITVSPPATPETTVIPKDKFRVIVTYESSVPGSSNGAVTDPAIQAYLNTHCPIGPDGKTPERRYWDQHETAAREVSPALRSLWQAAKQKNHPVPALIIDTGAEPLVLPLPKTPSETLSLLKKYGGE